ncbi:hypothetical protein HN587_01875 [Candidatus Woesearchaeota archaeon]|jgi:F0F1-type ATP synthase assembly protein I|nr:hypothetical protein [Candidatus Woesearchaeota archaeon]
MAKKVSKKSSKTLKKSSKAKLSSKVRGSSNDKTCNMSGKYSSGMLIPAGLLIGIGVGFLTNQVAAGTLIGLGIGFAVSYFMANKKK